MAQKLNKDEKNRLLIENVKFFKSAGLEDGNIYGVDLSRDETGFYDLDRGDGKAFAFSGKSSAGVGERLDSLLKNLQDLNEDIGAKPFLFCEKVSAMSHFTGLRAVSMAEGVFLLWAYWLEDTNKTTPICVYISSTAVKKFVTGKGRYVNKQVEELRAQYALKRADNPLKAHVMACLKDGFGLEFDNDNIADAAGLALFAKCVKDIVSAFDLEHPSTTDQLLKDDDVFQNHTSYQREAVVDFLTSFEILKENLTPYEYSKARKRVKGK